MGKGLAAGANPSLRRDEPCVDREGPPALARNSRLGALSEAAGPQPLSTTSSIRLRSIARHGRDGDISLDIFGVQLSV